LILVTLLAGCASGPRPVPSGATAAERLGLAESALVGAKNVTGTFEIDSKGENAAHLTGTLDLVDGSGLHLVAEGNFKSETVQLELDSRDPTGILRTTTKGPSVSSHRDPPADKLREAVGLGIARMGLMHNLALLSLDQPIEKTGGGFGEWVKATGPKDGASETVNGEACKRVEFGVEVEGKSMGEASVCIADATGLPLQRTSTLHFPGGDMTLSETFKWQMK
ncbi:MAG: hypothetical protein ABL886_00860, partial [Rhodoglobus sp.]